MVVAEIDEVRGPAVAEELTKDFGTEAFYIHTDATLQADNEAMIAAAVERWGSVDILVNNAWGGDRAGLKRTDQMPTDAMFHALNMKLMGPFWAMQAAFPHMRPQGWGRIVSLCSLNGVNAHMGSVHYNSSAEALRTLTRTAAREWAPYGITANAICPGAKTAAFRAFDEMAPAMADDRKRRTRWATWATPRPTSARSPSSSPARTPATSPATRSTPTAAATSTAPPGCPSSRTDRGVGQ